MVATPVFTGVYLFYYFLSQTCPNLPKSDSASPVNRRFAKMINMAKHQDLKDWLLLNEKVDKEEKKLFFTEGELRLFPKYKDATAKEILNAINTFHDLALITYQVFCKEELQKP